MEEDLNNQETRSQKTEYEKAVDRLNILHSSLPEAYKHWAIHGETELVVGQLKAATDYTFPEDTWSEDEFNQFKKSFESIGLRVSQPEIVPSVDATPRRYGYIYNPDKLKEETSNSDLVPPYDGLMDINNYVKMAEDAGYPIGAILGKLYSFPESAIRDYLSRKGKSPQEARPGVKITTDSLGDEYYWYYGDPKADVQNRMRLKREYLKYLGSSSRYQKIRRDNDIGASWDKWHDRLPESWKSEENMQTRLKNWTKERKDRNERRARKKIAKAVERDLIKLDSGGQATPEDVLTKTRRARNATEKALEDKNKITLRRKDSITDESFTATLRRGPDGTLVAEEKMDGRVITKAKITAAGKTELTLNRNEPRYRERKANPGIRGNEYYPEGAAETFNLLTSSILKEYHKSEMDESGQEGAKPALEIKITSTSVEQATDMIIENAMKPDGGEEGLRMIADAYKNSLEDPNSNLGSVAETYQRTRRSAQQIDVPAEANKVAAGLDSLREMGKRTKAPEVHVAAGASPEERQQAIRQSLGAEFSQIGDELAGNFLEDAAKARGEHTIEENKARETFSKENFSRNEIRRTAYRLQRLRSGFLDQATEDARRIGGRELAEQVEKKYEDRWKFEEERPNFQATNLVDLDTDQGGEEKSRRIAQSVDKYKEELGFDPGKNKSKIDSLNSLGEDTKNRIFEPVAAIERQIQNRRENLQNAVNAKPEVACRFASEIKELQLKRKQELGNVRVTLAEQRVKLADAKWKEQRENWGKNVMGRKSSVKATVETITAAKEKIASRLNLVKERISSRLSPVVDQAKDTLDKAKEFSADVASQMTQPFVDSIGGTIKDGIRDIKVLKESHHNDVEAVKAKFEMGRIAEHKSVLEQRHALEMWWNRSKQRLADEANILYLKGRTKAGEIVGGAGVKAEAAEKMKKLENARKKLVGLHNADFDKRRENNPHFAVFAKDLESRFTIKEDLRDKTPEEVRKDAKGYQMVKLGEDNFLIWWDGKRIYYEDTDSKAEKVTPKNELKFNEYFDEESRTEIIKRVIDGYEKDHPDEVVERDIKLTTTEPLKKQEQASAEKAAQQATEEEQPKPYKEWSRGMRTHDVVVAEMPNGEKRYFAFWWKERDKKAGWSEVTAEGALIQAYTSDNVDAKTSDEFWAFANKRRNEKIEDWKKQKISATGGYRLLRGDNNEVKVVPRNEWLDAIKKRKEAKKAESNKPQANAVTPATKPATAETGTPEVIPLPANMPVAEEKKSEETPPQTSEKKAETSMTEKQLEHLRYLEFFQPEGNISPGENVSKFKQVAVDAKSAGVKVSTETDSEGNLVMVYINANGSLVSKQMESDSVGLSTGVWGKAELYLPSVITDIKEKMNMGETVISFDKPELALKALEGLQSQVENPGQIAADAAGQTKTAPEPTQPPANTTANEVLEQQPELSKKQLTATEYYEAHVRPAREKLDASSSTEALGEWQRELANYRELLKKEQGTK